MRASAITTSVAGADFAPAVTAKLPTMVDADLAAAVATKLASGEHILVEANKYTGAIFNSPSESGPWSLLCGGELGDAFFAVAKKKTSATRLWLVTTLESVPTTLVPVSLTKTQLKVPQLKKWQTLDEGRMGHASPETRVRVAALAANRCQFAGCGEDLTMHATTGKAGVYSYYAHIVAASPDGPRGHKTLSAQLADDPDNFLLLCDKCHRLVDKVDPDTYKEDVLQRMRADSIGRVNRLLRTLRYKEVERLYILGNITGQMPHISDRDADEALWNAKLRASTKDAESVFEFGRAHHSPHDDGYWLAVFKTLAYDVPTLQGRINGLRNSGAPRPPLSVFPLHGTSVLLLAGRLLGDMAGTHVFQPHRNKVGEHEITRWSWPDDATPPPSDKYKVSVLQTAPNGQTDEAVLLVSLTFGITVERLPAPAGLGGSLTLPTVEISVENPNAQVIRHPDDLVLFGAAVDDALKILQDTWKVKKVRLFIGAPTSAVLKVGQKLQARHHSTFLCHEPLARGPDAMFAPTIEISPGTVRAVGIGQSVSLQT